MPRPPLPKITANEFELRRTNLRALLEIVREKYPAQWQTLIRAVETAGANELAVIDAVEAWLRKHLRIDFDRDRDHYGVADIAVGAALLLLAQDVQALRTGHMALVLLADLMRNFDRGEAPEPVRLRAEYLLGEGAAYRLGLQFDDMRERILADFTEKLDAALSEYRRNCERAGLREEPVSTAQRDRLELLAHRLVGGLSVAALAGQRRHKDDRRVQLDLACAAKACGLELPSRRGRPRHHGDQ